MNTMRSAIVGFVCAVASASCVRNAGEAARLQAIHLIRETIDLSQIVFVEPSSGMSDRALKSIQAFFPIVRAYPEKSSVPYHANDDVARFANLKSAIESDKKYLWAVKGGYGSARLFEQLKSIPPPSIPKVFIGYSDATFLHLFFGRWGWKTIHGAMPIDLARGEISYRNFTAIGEMISTQKGALSYGNIVGLNRLAKSHIPINGEVIGGNLTLLASSLGTPWELIGTDKIIFIEDTGVRGYGVDRGLNHLSQSGVLKDARAILFGEFLRGDEHVKYAIQRFADEAQLPVFIASNFGHGISNYPLPFGFVSEIRQNSDGEFTLTIPYDFR